MIIERKHMDESRFKAMLYDIAIEKEINFSKLEKNAKSKQNIDEEIIRVCDMIASDYESLMDNVCYLIKLKEAKSQLNEEQATLVRENRVMDNIADMINDMIS